MKYLYKEVILPLLAFALFFGAIMLCTFGIAYVAIYDHNIKLTQCKSEINNFCGNTPVKVVELYLLREGSKSANYYIVPRALVTNGEYDKVVTFADDLPVRVGQFWTLKPESSNCGKLRIQLGELVK